MRTKFIRGTMMATASASALWAVHAQAREIEAQSAEAPAANEEVKTSGDIIVTARRREERLQDVPISITALSARTLENRGIDRAQDLVQVTPSLKISAASQRRVTPSYELRGISSTVSPIGQDSPVAIYVDEVYQGRPFGQGSFVDMANVQVLLGPQGTLFGRNAAAGAILFTSNKPSDLLEAEVQGEIGNYDARRLSVMVNIPLSDNVAARFAGQRAVRDGYTHEINSGKDLDNENDWFGRFSLSAEFGAFANTFVIDGYKSDTNGTGVVPTAIRRVSDPAIPGVPAPGVAVTNGDAAINAFLGRIAARGPRFAEYTPGLNVFDRLRSWGISNVTTLELSSDLTVKNIIGYRNQLYLSPMDLLGTPWPDVDSYGKETGKSFSNELQLQGKALGGNLDYIVGAFFFKEKGQYLSISEQIRPNLFTNLNGNGDNKSYAVFAQGSYRPSWLEGVSLTLGARYTWDKRRAFFLPAEPAPRAFFNNRIPACTFTIPNPNAGLPGQPANVANPTCTSSGSASFSKPTWTVTLDYKAAPDVLVYLSHRRGYRSGGFNTRANDLLGQTVPFEPETISDVEAGMKAVWNLGGDVRLTTNVAGYYTWYENVQRTLQDPNGPIINGVRVTFTSIRNAASATIKGVELNGALNLGDAVELSGYFAYADAIHKTFGAAKNVPFGSMKRSAGAAIAVKPIRDEQTGTVTVNANLSYTGSYYDTTSINPFNPALPVLDPFARIPARTLVNANIAWDNIAGSSISASIFARNLFNKTYLTSALGLYYTGVGVAGGIYGEPRMYGLTVKYKFGR